MMPKPGQAGKPALPVARVAVPVLAVSALVPAATAGVLLGLSRGAGAALLAGVATVLAAGVGAGVLAIGRGSARTHWAVVGVVAGACRTLSGVALAFAVYLLASPARLPFWGTFLGAMLVAMVVEKVLLRWISKDGATGVKASGSPTVAGAAEPEASANGRAA